MRHCVALLIVMAGTAKPQAAAESLEVMASTLITPAGSGTTYAC